MSKKLTTFRADFTVTNANFEDGGAAEVLRILLFLTSQIVRENGGWRKSRAIFDTKGNHVGRYTYVQK